MISIYVDDTKIARTVSNEADQYKMQNLVNCLGEWSIRWDLKFNVERFSKQVTTIQDTPTLWSNSIMYRSRKICWRYTVTRPTTKQTDDEGCDQGQPGAGCNGQGNHMVGQVYVDKHVLGVFTAEAEILQQSLVYLDYR